MYINLSVYQNIYSYFLGIYHMIKIMLDRGKNTGKAYLRRGMALAFFKQLEDKMLSFMTQPPNVIGVQQRELLIKQLEKLVLHLSLNSEMNLR